MPSHPHEQFKYCTVCWEKIFIGGYVTKNHGDGSIGSGTCPQCGEHTYSVGVPAEPHPHETKVFCSCGDYYFDYSLDIDCSTCKTGSETLLNIQDSTGFFSYTAGDIIDVPMCVTLTCYAEYRNEYNDPSKIGIIDYGYPVFASFHSSVRAYTEADSVYGLPILYYIPQNVDYYSANGELLYSQCMIPKGPDVVFNSIPPKILTLSEKPAYTSTFALFCLDESVSHTSISLISYFNYD